jgi:putative transposase
MEVELTDHVGHERHQEPARSAHLNTRNGTTTKTLKTKHGSVGIDTPRDRDGALRRKAPAATLRALRARSSAAPARHVEAHLAEIYGVRRRAGSDQPGSPTR